jgi:hypothetical protein
MTLLCESMFNRKCRSLESIVSNVEGCFGRAVQLTDCTEGLGDHAVPDEVLEHSIWRVWGQRWKHTRCALSLPCPEDPAVGLLERDKLCFDVTLDVGAVGFAEALDGASVLAVA